MKRVLLVVPPSYRFGGPVGPTFNLGLGYIASVLREDGHDVAIYDANIAMRSDDCLASCSPSGDPFETYEFALQNPDHSVWLEVEQVVRQVDPDVIGITTKVADMKAALKIAQIAKKLRPRCVTVVGGPAATTCTDPILREVCVDFAIRGEGEETFRELLQSLSEHRSRLHKVLGLSIREDGGILHNANRPLIDNIDTLPFPARDLLLFADRISEASRRALMSGLITSRGCPYACTYCANKAVWGSQRVRMRSPESVVQEVLHLRDAYGVKNVVFWDDHLTTQRDRTVNLCQELIRMRADIRWLTFARANSIDEELLRLMKRAGCHELQIGVESGSERILKMTKKGISLRHIRLAAAVLRKVGIRWHAFLMIGFPGETPDEMQSTIQFIHELRPNSVELSVVTPYPGTEMFEAARRRGTLDETAWLSADPYKAESILVDTMPRDQFRDLVMRYRKECERYNRAQTRWTFRGLSAALSRRLRYVSMGLYKIHFFR